MSVAWVGVGVAAAGAISSASAAKKGAKAQSNAANQASETEQEAAAQMREDLAPWTGQGASANNLLGYYLGLNTTGASGGATSASTAPALTYDDLRKQLESQYKRSITTPGTTGSAPTMDGEDPYADPANWRNVMMTEGTGDGQSSYMNRVYTGPQTSSQIDEAGLDAAIKARLAEQDAATKAAQTTAQADPKYGSLLQGYRNGEEFDAGPAYDAGPDFSFTGKDLQNEPGYQFGLSQGEQGINRGQASRGSYLSGGAMKELSRFNQDYAGTKYNEGFSRALTGYNTNQATNLNEYNTNQTNRLNVWNTNKAAYDTNRNSIYSFLTGQSTIGQSSAARVGANNQQVATNVGANTMAAGVAQSAGNVATGNAITSGLNSAVNAYNGSNSLNSAAGWTTALNRSGGGYSGYTGYVGGSDPIGNMNTANNWTN